MLSRSYLVLILVFLGIIIAVSSSNSLLDVPKNTVTDLSWPNCDNTSVAYDGIIGVNGGLDFHPNPCLYNESKLFNTYTLYINTGYPGINYGRKFSSFPLQCDQNNYLCLAYNYGYNAAKYSITYASSQSVHAFTWWLDVENSNSWTDNVLQNRASLTGMVDALKKYTLLPTIGFYSYPGQWDSITGNWRNGFPVWVATGSTKLSDAILFCKNENFTGGDTWLSQYTSGLDHNYVCSNDYVNHKQL